MHAHHCPSRAHIVSDPFFCMLLFFVMFVNFAVVGPVALVESLLLFVNNDLLKSDGFGLA
jgi:hypothetical protein